jgi:CheY-like chemotaxis protein
VEALRKIAVGKNIAFYQQYFGQVSPRSSSGLVWQCVKKYCKSWFGFNICCGNEDERALLSADLVIQQSSFGSSRTPDTLPVKEAIRTLVIYDGTTPPSDRRSREQNRRIQSIGGPVGPYKLARALLELFREQVEKSSSDTDVSVAYAFSEGSTRNSMSSISFPPSREEVNVECTDPGASVLEPTKVSQSLKTSESIPQSTQLQQPMSLSGTTTDVGLTQIVQDVPISSYSPQGTFRPVSLGTAPALDSNLRGAQVSLRLLLVDDNPLNLQLLHRYLLKRKLDTVVIARNGVEAFDTVREAKTPFDIIFMDISMPEMDGFEATRLIRTYERSTQHQEFTAETTESNSTKYEGEGVIQETGTSLGDGYNAEARLGGKAYKDREVIQAGRGSHHTYVVALTGLASRRDRDRAEECGFDEYLTKPISFSKIGELLARLSAEKMRF